MIQTDTHLHTSFSSDSEASMESMILGSIERGMKTICITEHLDYDYPDNEDHLDFLLDFETYQSTFKSMKEKYQDRIELLLGVELGVQSQIKEELASFYAKHGDALDFIINSCHVVEHLDPYYKEFFEKIPVKENIQRYFEAIWENLHTFTDYQTAGHLDYILRYQPKPWEPFSYKKYQDILDAILEHLIQKEKALEVNTAGLKYGLPHPNPNTDILKRYYELGGRLITIGSDAHKPEHLAYDYNKLPDLLQGVGFKEYVVYKKKQPIFLPIS